MKQGRASESGIARAFTRFSNFARRRRSTPLIKQQISAHGRAFTNH
jgi:hypothetical protein